MDFVNHEHPCTQYWQRGTSVGFVGVYAYWVLGHLTSSMEITLRNFRPPEGDIGRYR